jgi:hypothetical protein
MELFIRLTKKRRNLMDISIGVDVICGIESCRESTQSG